MAAASPGVFLITDKTMQQATDQRRRRAFEDGHKHGKPRHFRTTATLWLTWPERAPGTVIALLGSVFLAAYVASLVWLPKPDGRIVVGDAVGYYVYLRSAVFDRDLDFDNEYVHFFGRPRSAGGDDWRIYRRTATGHLPNFMSVGPSLAWAPLFVTTASGVAAANALGADYPLDGYGRLFQATAGISGVLAAVAGVYLAFAWARDVFGTRAAIWSTLAVWGASSTLYYSLISPTYSHAVSMLTSALFFYVWGTTRDRQTLGRYALVGFLAGLNALVRWQDVVFLAAPLLEASWAAFAPRAFDWRRLSRAAALVLACLAAAFTAFLPQMGAWRAIYGSPFLVPQGEGFMRWTAPSLFAVLFSDLHGLISWTPLIAVAFVGCLWLIRWNRLVGTTVIVILAFEWYTNAAVADWWAGEAFGARRFISCFPLFVLGLAQVYSQLDSRLFAGGRHEPSAPASPHIADPSLRAVGRGQLAMAAITLAFVGLNVLLLVQYQAFLKGFRDIVPYPRGFYGLWVARFVVPFRLAERLWHAFL